MAEAYTLHAGGPGFHPWGTPAINEALLQQHWDQDLPQPGRADRIELA